MEITLNVLLLGRWQGVQLGCHEIDRLTFNSASINDLGQLMNLTPKNSWRCHARFPFTGTDGRGQEKDGDPKSYFKCSAQFAWDNRSPPPR